MFTQFTQFKIPSFSLLAVMLIVIFGASRVTAQQKNLLSYPELGLTTSLQIVQPSVGYWWGKTGVRFTGMYANKDHHEFHLNIGYSLSESAHSQHSINLLTSWVVGSDRVADYRYGATGIAYSVNYKGFFWELGLARPWRDDIGNLADDWLIPCGYFGYIYRFNN